jgi:hypothetical protein
VPIDIPYVCAISIRSSPVISIGGWATTLDKIRDGIVSRFIALSANSHTHLLVLRRFDDKPIEHVCG